MSTGEIGKVMGFGEEALLAIKRIFLKILWTLQSRKFWAAIAATILAMQSCAGFEECANAIAAIWIAFIAATAYEDAHQ